MKYAARFITLASVIQILGYLYALPGHLDEASWSAHAQFHHVLGWIWLTGLNVAMITLAWGPLQKRERWSFWLLLALFFFAQGGHYIASLVVPLGRPSQPWFDWAITVMALLLPLDLFLDGGALQNQFWIKGSLELAT